METIGERLRTARLRRVLTQQELQARSGILEVTISRIENGHHQPRASTVRKLAVALDVTAEWLMFGEKREDGTA